MSTLAKRRVVNVLGINGNTKLVTAANEFEMLRPCILAGKAIYELDEFPWQYLIALFPEHREMFRSNVITKLHHKYTSVR